MYHQVRSWFHYFVYNMILYYWFVDAALAGIKPEDHLIEVNGENIENVGDEEVKQRIRSIKYPQPLQILVADSATYNYYKRQNKVIHSGLPTVKKLPTNIIERSVSVTPTYQGIFIILFFFFFCFKYILNI